MFTGIVEAVGRITGRTEVAGLLTLKLETELAAGLAPGASIACSGVCLTATGGTASEIFVDVANETVRCTTLGAKRAGDRVNLERPLRADGRLDGHFVQGHVDGRGVVVVSDARGGDRVLRIGHSHEAREADDLVVDKGSIAVDGVSLTVTSCGQGWFEVMLIPHTLSVTTLGELVPGAHVNLEYDILAKYLVRFSQVRRARGSNDE